MSTMSCLRRKLTPYYERKNVRINVGRAVKKERRVRAKVLAQVQQAITPKAEPKQRFFNRMKRFIQKPFQKKV